jgi:hypothetical protein
MIKTLRDRYGSAREIAGATATNKAGLANKSAKQAAAMSNASKMTQALLGAQAANDAIAQGFDEGLSKGADMAAQVASEEARTKEREQNQKQFEASQRLTREENEKNRKLQEDENKKNRIWNFASQVGGSMLSGLWG